MHGSQQGSHDFEHGLQGPGQHILGGQHGFVFFPIVLLANLLWNFEGQQVGSGLHKHPGLPWHSDLGQSCWSPFFFVHPHTVYKLPALSSKLLQRLIWKIRKKGKKLLNWKN